MVISTNNWQFVPLKSALRYIESHNLAPDPEAALLTAITWGEVRTRGVPHIDPYSPRGRLGEPEYMNISAGIWTALRSIDWESNAIETDYSKFVVCLWTFVSVSQEDLRRLWPSNGADTFTSGFPGRPSSKHLYMAQFQKRALEGRLESTLDAEARHLEEWLIRERPNAPRATHKTILNAIRDSYREAMTHTEKL